MEDIQDLKNFIKYFSTVVKIVKTTYMVCEEYEKEEKAEENCCSERQGVRPVSGTRYPKDSIYYTTISQLKEKDKIHFIRAMRMNVDNFNLLVMRLKPRLERFSNRGVINPETRLGVTLMHLAQGSSVNVLAITFKLGISTVRKILYETCDSIWEELRGNYIAPLNAATFKCIAEKFYVKIGMPHCLGAIGGRHINIARPRYNGSYSYKKKYSIVLMGACDADYMFTHVHVSLLPNQSDGGVLAQSDFGTQLLNETLDVPAANALPGSTIPFPYYFVADSGFPLKSNLMRPFPGRNLSKEKEQFNTMLEKARDYIDNTFGILVNRWRILNTVINCSPQNADKIVLATIVLHNFLMLQQDKNYFTPELVDHTVNNENIQGEWRNEINPLISYQNQSCNRSSTTAFQLREDLKDYFQNNST